MKLRLTASCILCASRRGTRPCPALKTDICTICCGTKRRRTVDCPEDCQFLKQGRRYQEQRAGDTEPLKRIRELDAEYVNALDQSILEVRNNRFRDLLDREVKEALENVLKTVETGEKGLHLRIPLARPQDSDSGRRRETRGGRVSGKAPRSRQ